jgi:hypothetical protein
VAHCFVPRLPFLSASERGKVRVSKISVSSDDEKNAFKHRLQ